MANAVPRNRYTGLDLKLRRIAAGVSQTDVGAAMGVSRRRVGNIEAMIRPPSTAVTRYLVALDTADR